MQQRFGAGLVLCIALLTSGCGNPYAAMRNHFDTSIPAAVKVVHFYGEAYKDPVFLWELAPVDDAFLKKLVANAKLKVPAPGQDVTQQIILDWSAWWDYRTIAKLPEVYYQDPEVNGSFYRIWVDRKRNRLFILFVNL
jgi:hypothetical protein